MNDSLATASLAAPYVGTEHGPGDLHEHEPADMRDSCFLEQ
jgi:hypothetical protein